MVRGMRNGWMEGEGGGGGLRRRGRVGDEGINRGGRGEGEGWSRGEQGREVQKKGEGRG